MIVDKIKLRKIRFDVIDHLEKEDYIAKVQDVISNKEKYFDNIEYLQNLLRDGSLDASETDFEIILQLFERYLSDYYNIESIEHSKMLDYLAALSNTDNGEAEEELYFFVLQILQIQKLQSNLLDNVLDIVYLDDDYSLRDIQTNERIIDIKDLNINYESLSNNEITQVVLNYFADGIIDNQRKIATKMEFDDDGIFVAEDGEEIFSKNEINKLKETANTWIENLYIAEENVVEDKVVDEYSESLSKKELAEDVTEDNLDDIFDDVSVADNDSQSKKEADERLGRLKDTLRNSTNKIIKR